MKTKKVETSLGEVEVRGFTAREMTEQKLQTALALQDIEKRARNLKPNRIRDLKVSATTDIYYETIARGITSHSFDLQGKTLSRFLEELEPADVDAIEEAQGNLNNPGADALGNSECLPEEEETESTTQEPSTS